jgi:hypothetical protein
MEKIKKTKEGFRPKLFTCVGYLTVFGFQLVTLLGLNPQCVANVTL